MIGQPRVDEGETSNRLEDRPHGRGPGHARLRLAFSRRLLVVAAVTLACLITVCAAGVAELVVSRQHDEFAQQFASHREALKEEVDRHEASVRQLVVTYQLAKEYWERGNAGARKIQPALNAGPVQIVPDSPAASTFSVVSSLTSPADASRLAQLIDLAGYSTTFPLVHLDHSLAISQGFIYTPDYRFLATFPPLTQDQADRLSGRRRAEDVIAARAAAIEQEMRENATDGRQDKVIWVTGAKDPLNLMTTTYFATSIYEGGKRTATIVSSIPCNRFNQYFLHDDGDPRFFVIACKLQRLLGVDETSARETHWAQIISNTPSMYRTASERPQRIWREGSFFIIQRVPGPQWVAVYAYTWGDLLGAVKWELLFIVLSVLGGCAIVAGGALWINREVIQPSRRRLDRLLESEAFSRSVVQVAPVALAVVGRDDGDVLLQNDEARNLQNAFAGDAAETFGPASLLARAGMLVRHHAAVTTGPETVRRFEMEPDLEIAYAPARYRGDEVFVIGAVDLAKRKEIERRLRESRQRALTESHEKGMFLATVSHEIRTPLHGALGNLELLAGMGLTREQHSRLTIARDSFGALLSLINGVLDLSRIEAGDLTLQEQPAHIDQLVEQASRTFAADAQKNSVRLLCLIAPAARGTWVCDAPRFTQVVTNLIGNAVKFTHRGSITVSLSLASDDAVVLRVADSGRGIPEDEIERIFIPFVQGTAGSRNARAGTGLGLSLCHKIVGRMGGDIAVESEPGVGTIFTVTLPLRRDCAEYLPRMTGPCPDFRVNCDNPSWKSHLEAQLSAWFPYARISPGGNESDGLNTSTVLIDARDWIARDGSLRPGGTYLRIMMALDGPLHPVTSDGTVYVSAYSGQLFRAAIDVAMAGANPDGHEDAQPAHEVAAGAWSALRVLVVEDDRVSAQLMDDQLGMLGVGHVDVVHTAEDGFRRCAAGAYDLVITDSNLPGKSGTELLSELRAAGIEWPVVLCTADATMSASAGFPFDALIIKPSTLGDLSHALGTVTGRDGVPRASPESGVDRLLSLFTDTWERDREQLRSMVQAGHVPQVLERLHRIRGALLILDGGELVCHLDDWSATIAQSKRVVEADGQSFVDAVERWLSQRALPRSLS
ncbi:ATP-binding protein [Burkholderia multivorans]|uniref:ATP-binding protein n=1 Tax=Burkholderia multivorans TaxID=87883 RepID=UPI001C27D5AB|nr:ATP-binding protein [Burkholderia multivorans]MBU9337250.1 response regulator [Burkholderia multivorans]MCA8480115.1 response regulator [Burkholderia multivorans]